MKKCGAIGLLVGVLLLSSCAVGPRSSAGLPAAVTLNSDAGRGHHLYVTLRLEGGEELPFMVDTGAPMTLVAESLAPRLGQCLGTSTLRNFGDRYDANCYAIPKLYLGSTPLVTDSNVLTCSLVEKMASGLDRPVLGILGMDCLQHYCIQLDFKAGKMRFLDPDRTEPTRLGKAFVLTFSSEGSDDARRIRPYIQHNHLVGAENVNLLIDTGHQLDGALAPALLRREIQAGTLQAQPDPNDNPEPDHAYLAKCTWSGESYADLILGNGRNTTESDSGENSLGLRFLARHVVTLDFPGRTMYLKKTRSGPLASTEAVAVGRAAAKSAYRSARQLMKTGQLPGWSKQDRGAFSKTAQFRRNPDRVTFTARKKNDPSTYHYTFTRPAKDAPWKLQKAWRTDSNDATIDEYPVP